MSGRLFSIITTADVALSAGVAKTVLQLATTAGTNLPRALAKKLILSFDGVATTNTPVLVEIAYQTSAGTGTSVTPVKIGDYADTVLSAGFYNFSAEPTKGGVIEKFRIHPQGGVFEIAPLQLEIPVPANSRLGIILTAAQAVNATATLWADE